MNDGGRTLLEELRVVGSFSILEDDEGIDTVMPDKIVKRVINEILVKAGLEPVNDDIEFIKRAEKLP